MNSGEDYRVISNVNLYIYIYMQKIYIFLIFSFWWKFGNSYFHWNPYKVFAVVHIFCKLSCWANYIHSSRASMRGREANNLITERIQSRYITLCIFHPTSLKVIIFNWDEQKKKLYSVRTDTELQNHWSWKRPPRLLSPTIQLTSPNHVPSCHFHMSLNTFRQGGSKNDPG